jgi:hypothetical protein
LAVFVLFTKINWSFAGELKMNFQSGLVVIVSHTLFLPLRKFASVRQHALDCAAKKNLAVTRHFSFNPHLAFKPSREIGKPGTLRCPLHEVFVKLNHSFTKIFNAA